jgi:hypothetical protein
VRNYCKFYRIFGNLKSYVVVQTHFKKHKKGEKRELVIIINLNHGDFSKDNDKLVTKTQRENQWDTKII